MNRKKLKVAQLTPYYYPSIGGVEVVVQYTSEELVKRGHEVHVFTTTRSHKGRPPISRPSSEVLNGVKVRRFKSIFNLGHMSIYPALVPKLWNGRFDVIHFHNYRHPHCEIASFIGKWKSIPTFLHGHGPFFAAESAGTTKAMIYRVYDKIAQAGLLQRVDGIIALNKFEKRQYIRMGVHPDKIQLVHNAAEDECFEDKDPTSFIERHNLEGKRIMLFLGILNDYKRPDLLVQALPKIIKKFPNVILLFVGPNANMYSKMKSIGKELNVENFYKWIGPLQGAEKHLALAAAEFTLLPSDEDPFPLVVLESMAQGKPVIGSDATGPSDMIDHGETGFIVRRGNADEIAEASIKLLLDKELLSTMGQKAKKVASQKYSVPRVVDQMEKMYFDVINSKQARDFWGEK